MNSVTTLRAAVLMAGLVILSGCLSQEKGETGFVEDNSGGSGGSSSQNSAPKIWGSPGNAVKTGDSYSFTPSADDPDGDAVTFSIENKPRWASFDSNTGKLSGRPLLGDEGVYGNITITASDGSATANMSPFSIEVTQTALGAMTLSWTAPLENEDGSALTDLAGYNLYYGEQRGSYPNRIRIDNVSVTTYIVENLLPRTYYVVATAFNAAGIESSYSNEAIKTVAAQ